VEVRGELVLGGGVEIAEMKEVGALVKLGEEGEAVEVVELGEGRRVERVVVGERCDGW